MHLQVDACCPDHAAPGQFDSSYLVKQLASPPHGVLPLQRSQQALWLHASRQDLDTHIASVVLQHDAAPLRDVLEAQHA